MGGNLFKLGRRPRAEYLVIEEEVRAYLRDLVGAERFRVPRYYADKADFGDLDVLVSTAALPALGGFEGFAARLADDLGVTQATHTGHVYSTVFRGFQVDYFLRAPALFEASYNYLSFNDIGNLIGKIYRRLGFKYGEEGLCYVFRRAEQESYKRELLVSRDWPRILGLIGLDVAAWEAGFHGLEDMFEWVVASPYFSVAPYERLSRSTERRANARRTIARFLEWIEARGVDKRYAYAEGRDAYVDWAAAAFPEAGLLQALADERAREAEDAALREKYSGGLVRAWTGLEGRQLGGFLAHFGRAYPRERLLEMPAAAIKDAVLEHRRAHADEF
ncbi:MAG: hypothetical protein R3A79_25735 [Nannocystaceae bacterium]